MKQVFTFFSLLLLSSAIFSQDSARHAPPGYDLIESNIQHGKIDTIIYRSATVGNTRRSLIYTPPGYSKNNKYPVLY